ncbi:MAG TPA: hypothetical protein VIQ39_06005, partial [Methyloceanibacter sp.]
MREADAIRDRAPVKAAGLAQLAVAIAILSVFPVRLGNLGTIRIGENLIRPGGPGTPYWLVFSRYDVKNRIRLETVFDADVAKLIDNYIDNHFNVLLRGANEPWLFPGMKCGHKGLATLSGQITKRIEKATGLFITVHQFRHAGGQNPATMSTCAGSSATATSRPRSISISALRPPSPPKSSVRSFAASSASTPRRHDEFWLRSLITVEGMARIRSPCL